MNTSWPSGGSQLNLPDLIGGRYRLEYEIAAGGMARVYRATDLKLKRPVAVKILRHLSPDDQHVRVRFQREAKAAGTLNHEHIVAIYDAGFDETTAYLVMPLIEGPTLREERDRRRSLQVREVITIGRQIAGALDHAHARGIVHRDIKPANIVLVADRPHRVGGRTDTPAAIRAMLLDFGIAREFRESATETGEIFGTAGYLAPERAQGQPTTPAADLYSLGVVLYELLTGRLPFPADDPHRLQSRTAAPPPLEVPGIPAPLDALVMRCLAIDPKRRPTAAQLAAALLEIERRSAAPTGRILPGGTETERLTPVDRTRQPLGRAWQALLLLPVLLAGLAAAATVRDRLSASSTVPPPALESATINIPAVAPPIAAPPVTIVPPTVRPPESVRVPDVTGRSESDARRTLSEIGFRPAAAVTTVERRDLPAAQRGGCDGHVLSTAPRAGTLAQAGSEIRITLCQPDKKPPQGNGPRNNRNNDD